MSELGYSALADLIISKTPVEKRKFLLNYKKKVSKKNHKFKIFLSLPSLTFLFQGSWTPLLLSSKQGHDKIVKSLLDAGASMSETNKVAICG